jgi:DNA-binding CsgD family transcriptional regulator
MEERIVSLNDQEIEITLLICQDLTMKEIAYVLDVDIWTVIERCKALIDKTNSINTIGIVKYAIRSGIYKL